MKHLYRILFKYINEQIIRSQLFAIRALVYKIEILILGEDKYSLDESDVRIRKSLVYSILNIGYKKDKKENLNKVENEDFDFIYSELRKDDTLNYTIASYFRIQQYYYYIRKRIKDENFYEVKALEYDTDSAEIKTWAEFNRIRKSIRILSRKLLSEKKDVQTYKIDVSTSDFFTYLSILGVLFIVTGYLQITIFYNWYGIDITPFYNIDDYLVKSLGAIPLIMISSLFGVLGAYSTLNADISLSSSPKATDASPLEDKYKRRDSERYIALFMFFIFTYFEYSILGKFPINSLMMIYIIALSFIAPVIAHRYFKNGLKALFILIFFSLYTAFVARNIGDSIINPSTDYKNYSWEIQGIEKHLILGTNSTYIFCQDTLSKEFLIIPKSELKSVRIKRP